MTNIFSQLASPIGMVGVFFVLVAYFLLNTNRLYALSMSYQLLNFFGALFILYSLWFEWNSASVVVESVWTLISVVGIYRAARTKQTVKHFSSK